MTARLAMVVVVAGVAGCTMRSERIPFPQWDGGPIGNDAGSPAAPPSHECDEARLMDDPWNCGACGVTCGVDEADRCVHGECRCGASAECGGGADCRFGRCVPVDPGGRVCEFDDECLAGQACIEAHCSHVDCVPEECDGYDNDCDGVVDGDARGPIVQWCSSAPEGAPLLSPCMRGFQVCESGSWGDCVGEVAPTAEQGFLGCDGVDNDCDGCVDGVVTGGVCVSAEPVGFDILFAIDTSGSMVEEIEAVRTATRDFTFMFAGSAEFNFALALVPGRADGQATLAMNLRDFGTFSLGLAGVTALGGGEEPTWDVVYEAAIGDLGVSWRDGTTRIIILFSDEDGQTYRRRRGLSDVDEASMCDALTHGEVFAAVADPAYYGDYDDCGLTFPISADAVAMAESLSSIIADPCR